MDINRILHPAIKRFYILFKHTWNIALKAHPRICSLILEREEKEEGREKNVNEREV